MSHLRTHTGGTITFKDDDTGETLSIPIQPVEESGLHTTVFEPGEGDRRRRSKEEAHLGAIARISTLGPDRPGRKGRVDTAELPIAIPVGTSIPGRRPDPLCRTAIWLARGHPC